MVAKRAIEKRNPPFFLIDSFLHLLWQQRVPSTVMIVPLWSWDTWWPMLCPDGVHMISAVVDWLELDSTSAWLFRPGLGRANERGVGRPGFRVFALKFDFSDDAPATMISRCTVKGGCAKCFFGKGLLHGLRFRSN